MDYNFILKLPIQKKGFEIIKKFVIDISGCEPKWNMPNYVETAVKKIQETVGSNEVFSYQPDFFNSSIKIASAPLNKSANSFLFHLKF